jgi:hypothetical protein
MPLTPPAPSAPGALLHPTSIDQPVCTPATPTKVGTPISCTTTVHDTFGNPADLNPPWGTITWTLDGGVIGTCPLTHIPNGSANSCSLPYPLGSGFVGSHTLESRLIRRPIKSCREPAERSADVAIPPKYHLGGQLRKRGRAVVRREQSRNRSSVELHGHDPGREQRVASSASSRHTYRLVYGERRL